MKLSFAIPSKPSSRPTKKVTSENTKDNEQETKPQFVTEFDASKTLTQKPNFIIPPLDNTYRPEKRMKNLQNLSTSAHDSDLRFELEAPSTAEMETDISFGLNLRTKENNDKKSREDPIGSNPASIGNLMLQKLKEDINSLPDDRGFDEFVDVPVEGFGAALLAGYGWSEGKGVGRNAKEDVKVVQFVRRAGTEGLGFVPESHDTKQKRRNHDPPLVAPKGPDGRTRHVVGVDEKLIPREPTGVFVGKIVRIIGGRHLGLKGKVVAKSDSDGESCKVVLKLLKSEEEVSVGLNEVAELGSVEEEKCLKKLKELKIRGKDNESRDDTRDSSSCGEDRKDSRSRGHREKRDSGKEDNIRQDKRNRDAGKRGKELIRESKSYNNRDGGREEGDRIPVLWLTSHIRVRIISKDFKGGKLYLKKGEVMDVVGPAMCDISMDGNKELIQGVDQRMLETALPKPGGPVLVLFGKHKGVFGNLVKRDKEKETGVVRDADSHALLNVRLEQIAEYTGDPSYIGY